MPTRSLVKCVIFLRNKMANIFVCISLLIVLTAPVYSLKCNEGFNASFSGIPFYHWEERECSDNSECFVQELGTKMFDTQIEVVILYGGCISRTYASLVTCENLFGAKSKLDPSVVFNMIPDLDQKIDDMLKDFRGQTVEQIKILFSSGNGVEEFVHGIYKSIETIGFDMKKAMPLIEPTAKCLSLFLELYQQGDFDQYLKLLSKLNNATIEALDVLGNLDTENIEITSNIYGFIENFKLPLTMEQLKQSKIAPSIENLPGLIKSTIPKFLDPDSWYDILFQLLGDVRFQSPKKSSSRVIATVKSVLKIPEEYNKYLDNVFDTAPELVQQMINKNFAYARTWAAELVKLESDVNPVTARLSTSILKLIFKLTRQEISADINTLITFIPGLFYRYFPEKSNDIDRIFNTLSEGFESTDFSHQNSTLQKTKMSDFIVNIVDKTVLSVAGADFSKDVLDSTKAVLDYLIINFSRTFYTMMTSKYVDQLDIFFTTLDDGFRHFPDKYDAGKIIMDLITNFGETVPEEIKPLLDNTQNVIDFFVSFSQNTVPDSNRSYSDLLIDEGVRIIEAYKVAFPESKYPDFVQRFIELLAFSIRDGPGYDNSKCYEINYDSPTWSEDREACFDKVYEEYNTQLTDYIKDVIQKGSDLSVDISFVLFDDFNTLLSPVKSALIDAFPAYEILIRLMNVLDPADIKDLLNEYSIWMVDSSSNSSTLSFDSFVSAVNTTVAKITSKLGDVTNELRKMFAPDFCRYLSCSDDICNRHTVTDDMQTWIKPKQDLYKENEKGQAVTVSNEDTTSGSKKISASILINMGVMFLIGNALK